MDDSRVEDSMRPLVRNAIAASSARERKARQDELDAARETEKGKGEKGKTALDTSTKSKPSSQKRPMDHESEISDSEDTPLTKHKKGEPKPAKQAAASIKPTPSDRSRPTEFTKLSSSAPRRLNDIAQAPPTLSRVPKARKLNHTAFTSGDTGKGKKTTKADGVLSMAQRAMMDAEREKAIQRYRELKERRMAEAGKGMVS
jgi:hypothetical protein